MRKLFVVTAISVLAVGSTACATKKFVRTSVGEVNDKVEATNRQLEETQERTRRNEGRISEVDQKAAEAAQAAQVAHNAANEANAAASSAANTAKDVGVHADAIEKASKRLVYEVVLSEDQGNFKFGKSTLPDEAKVKIDEIIAQLKSAPNGAYLEIEGHTDNVGNPKTNDRIGMERAEAVKRYLYESHQIPLHKMNVISYGEAKPIAPNKTRDGRAQNRRVVIKVLT